MKAVFAAIAALFWFGAAQASQVTILSIESSWTSASVIDNRPGGVENAGLSGVGTNTLSWGEPFKGHTKQSGFVFEHEKGIVNSKHSANSLFNVGTFTHINRVIHCDEHLDVARLNMRVTASFDGIIKTFDTSYEFSLWETPNNNDPCANVLLNAKADTSVNKNGCADRVRIEKNDSEAATFEHNGRIYTFELFGFEGGSEFWTIEDMENHAFLRARFSVTEVPLPAGAWLLLGGLAGLALVRRRARV
jgi:hypothetical protein